MRGTLKEIIIDNCFLIKDIEKIETEHNAGSEVVNITIKLKNTTIYTKIKRENVLLIYE